MCLSQIMENGVKEQLLYTTMIWSCDVVVACGNVYVFCVLSCHKIEY